MKKWLPLVALAGARFIMVLDQSVMNVSISTLVDDFGEDWKASENVSDVGSNSLVDGKYRIKVGQASGFGAPTLYAENYFTVDNTDPDTSVVSGPDPYVGNAAAPAHFVFGGNDPETNDYASGIDYFNCRIDGGPWDHCTPPGGSGPYTYDVTLPEGGHTLDVVAIDKHGYIAIKGRLKRFAKIGGEMVSLTVVENCATALWPDNMHAAVSIPDARKGEQIVLVAHGGVMDMLYRAAAGVDLQAPRTWNLGNAAANRLLWSSEGFSIVGWSDTSHLDDDAVLDETTA